ncbi:MAG TPA: pyridoxamine kinase [Candidatus Choladousia intestinipullorum]|nr:pyridoxamine kinase [Candidatus Choladousia intestinipullorum]
MKTDHNHQKKIAVINDFSGFGRCSIAVALPIISMMKIQCCPVPTSIFSNHTGFDSYFFEDYTDRMQPYINEWKKLGLQFSGIMSGFLGSKEQIQIVLRFFREFGTKDNIIVVDPVMGDYGKTYSTYTPQMCSEMKKLAAYADILTPNLTEACILTDTPYHEEKWRMKEITALAEKLSAMGPEKIVITGIVQGEFIANYCYEKGKPGKIRRTHKVGTQRSGTGDIFASIIAADAVNGVPFGDSVRKASLFIKRCIERSTEMELPLTDGVCFEEFLGSLK